MKIVAIAAFGVAALEGVAWACSCIAAPDDPAELREMAADYAKEAVGLVAIEVQNSYQPGGAETVRVTKDFTQGAAGHFRIERGPFASSASCDKTYDAGDRDIVILFNPSLSDAMTPVYRISGLCAEGLIEKPAFRDELIRLLEQKRNGGERG